MEKDNQVLPRCRLSDADYEWVKTHRERDELCTVRRRKIVEALLVWASIGIASAIVAGLTGAAKIIWNAM